MKNIGLKDLLLAIENANINKDRSFAMKLRDLLNDKIKIGIEDEDYQYIIDNYTVK